MFRRNQPPPEPAEPAAGPTGKGHATPRRRVAEQANKRPLVPTDRKAASRASRERMAEARARQQRAFETGEERYLPKRDKGPARRWARDYIDSHSSMSEYLMFIAMAMFIVMVAFSTIPSLQVPMIIVMYAVVFAVIVEAWLRGRTLRKLLTKKFGVDGVPKGTVWYGITRSFQLRRMRLPKPQVKRGQYPS